MRHTSLSMHYKLFQNVALTTGWAGNSPGVFKEYYKKMVTKEEARQFWVMLPTCLARGGTIPIQLPHGHQLDSALTTNRLLKNDFRPHFHAKTPMILMVVFQKHGFFNALLMSPLRYQRPAKFSASCRRTCSRQNCIPSNLPAKTRRASIDILATPFGYTVPQVPQNHCVLLAFSFIAHLPGKHVNRFFQPFANQPAETP
jgi:hypothetical protein